jgi:phenylpyruvate tautomerase PptA (4-oxalocrotonate tautomerase family)
MEERTMTTTAGDDIRNVRVQVVTPPNALSRPGQIQLVPEISEIIAKHARDPWQAERIWVMLTEAAEGGWGIARIAYGKSKFLALAEKAAQASRKITPGIYEIIFPKCHSLTIVRECNKIRLIWFGASTAPLLSESARWTMPIFLVDAHWGCRDCCGKLSRLGLR